MSNKDGDKIKPRLNNRLLDGELDSVIEIEEL